LNLPYPNGKKYPDHMAKSLQVCKWITFAISTFVAIEGMASAK
jgi:hypothetical protein